MTTGYKRPDQENKRKLKTQIKWLFISTLDVKLILTITNGKHFSAIHDSWDSMSYGYDSAVSELAPYRLLQNGVGRVVHRRSGFVED